MSKAITKFNFKEFKPVLAVSRSTLRKSQAKLYDLLVEKLNSGDAVTLKELREIWYNHACRNKIDGVPHRTQWGYWGTDGEWHGNARDIPMTDKEIDFTAMDWGIRTIGILVIRGYLKAIPMVELV
jgi:hypothetical protein